MTKQLTIIGGSRGVGLLTVREALSRGHRVTSLSRSTGSLPNDANLTAVTGSASQPADVAKAIEGADAVIVTLGMGTKLTWDLVAKPSTFYADAAQVLVDAVPPATPLIVLTGFGAGASGAYGGLAGVIFKTVLRKTYADKTVMEEIVTAGSAAWEIVRPGRLTDKPATGAYKVATELTKGMKVGAISRSDVAAYLVAQGENPTNLDKYVSLG